jgi:hypothetical protein
MSDSLSNSTPKDDCQAPEIKANDSKTFILSDSEKKIMNLQLFIVTLKNYYYKPEK